MKTIAWTGHRPKDLHPSFTYQQFAAILDGLKVNERADIAFITGGALGIDTWAAEYAITRGIPLDLHLPFRFQVQSKGWSDYATKTLEAHIAQANSVKVIHPGDYDVSAYQKRNISMVDDADIVFTVWTGKKFGGTFNCIRYALNSAHKEVYNLLPADGKLHHIRSI